MLRLRNEFPPALLTIFELIMTRTQHLGIFARPRPSRPSRLDVIHLQKPFGPALPTRHRIDVLTTLLFLNHLLAYSRRKARLTRRFVPRGSKNIQELYNECVKRVA